MSEGSRLASSVIFMIFRPVSFLKLATDAIWRDMPVSGHECIRNGRTDRGVRLSALDVNSGAF